MNNIIFMKIRNCCYNVFDGRISNCWKKEIEYISRVNCIVQKQPSRGVLRKRCSKNMHQIYRRTPMPKSDFNKVALQFYENHTSTWVFSSKFVASFQNTFSQEHLWKTASNCCDQLRYKLDQIRQIRS